MTHSGRDAEGLNEPYVDLTSIVCYGRVCHIAIWVVKTSGRHLLLGKGSRGSGGKDLGQVITWARSSSAERRSHRLVDQQGLKDRKASQETISTTSEPVVIRLRSACLFLQQTESTFCQRLSRP